MMYIITSPCTQYTMLKMIKCVTQYLIDMNSLILDSFNMVVVS